MDGIQLSIMEPDRGMRESPMGVISPPFWGEGDSQGEA